MSVYSDQISSLSPKIWYRFNETSGTPSNSGSLSTTSTFTNLLLNETSSVDGRAVYLNGTSARIQLPAHPAFSLFDDRSFTIECWVKIANADTNATGPFEIFRLNPASSPHYTISLTVGGTSGNRGKILLTSQWTTQLTSTNAIDDDTWHHIVYTYNTSSVKLYIDGVLDQSTTPSSLPASFSYDASTKKLIGAGYVGTAQSTINQYLKGRIDEFAAYDYELTSQNILDNYNAGASIVITDTVATASALAVEATVTVDSTHDAVPMTASSLFVATLPSTIDLPKMVEQYLSEFSLEQWYKFDDPATVTNYGTGGTVGDSMAFNGGAVNIMHGGIQGSGALYLPNTPAYIVQAFGATEPYNPEITDHEFALGFYIKIDSGYSNDYIFKYYNAFSVDNYYDLIVSPSGTITFRSKGTQEAVATYATAINDNQWHFVYIEASATNNLIQISVDNSALVTTSTVASNRPTGINAFRIGGQATGATRQLTLSHYFVGNYGLMDSTARGNLLTYDNTPIQASARMPIPKIKFSNKFNDLVSSYVPRIEFRLDEASGTPINYGTNGISISKIGSNLTYLQPTQNKFAYKFTNADTYIQGDWTSPAGTFSTNNRQTMVAVFKTETVRGYEQIIGSMGMKGFLGSGITLAIQASTGHLTARVNNGFAPANTESVQYSTSVADGVYHLAVVVRDGVNLRLYLDGKLKAEKTDCAINLADSGTYGISAEAKYNSQTASAKDLWIDEYAVMADEMSTQEVFELWQSLNVDGSFVASNATLPEPTQITGTGNIQTPAPMTASALIVDPTQTDELNLIAGHLDAHSEFLHPNYSATVLFDVEFGADAFTASALFHLPGISIGDGHIAVDMAASAEMVHPAAIAGGSITVSTAVGGPAELVMPGIVTIKGGLVNAAPMTSNAFMPIPPDYFTLQDDKWYLRLFAQHTTPNIEDAFTTGQTGNPSYTQTAQTFLKFFNTETVSIAPGSIEKLENNLTVNDADDLSASLAANLTPAPLMTPGFFDDQGRKAVLFENIEFEIDEEIYNSRKPYSLEFSIKTTKANQIVAKGKWRSYTGPQRAETGLGLYNGKLYIMQTNTTTGTIGDRTPHPSNPDVGGTSTAIIGNKNVADGQWHHIIVQQGYEDNRIQIWVDGQLDRQYIGVTYSRPYILGNNSGNTTYQSEFYTSAWSYDKQEFLSEYDVSLNYIGYLQYEPIKAAPMLATANIGNHKAQGNRGRALLLYWWPVTGPGDVNDTDREQFGYFDESTFDKEVLTVDYIEQPPQEWYGWDLYPVDINGRYVSDLVKTEAYGGAENIRLNVTNPGARESLTIKENRRGYFRDPITDARRYIDLVNDIDLSNFEAIFFRNYPDQSRELDTYAREEFSDSYFNLRERELYDDFVKSVRAAVDQGLSLFVSNTQLALDLGIVDRVEEVSDLYDVENETDPYTLTKLLEDYHSYTTKGAFLDTYRNNRLRVVNTIPELTGDAGYILKDFAYFKNDDAIDYGGANRYWVKYEYKPNGLQIGDEFVYANAHPEYAVKYQAVPFANVKCGTIITAFANTYAKGTDVLDNPYKDYATSIAVQPGDILNGSPVKGKIFVNFTERLSGETFDFLERRIESSIETGIVDLSRDYWINIAFNNDLITAEKRDELLNDPDNLDRMLEDNILTQDEYNKIIYWDLDGANILTKKTKFDDILDPNKTAEKERASAGFKLQRKVRTRFNKSGVPTSSTTYYSGQLFSFSYARRYEVMALESPSMLTAGIRWLSTRTEDLGLVIRVEAMTASATAVNADSVVADRDNSVNAPALLASASIIEGLGYTLTDKNVVSLPMFADGSFGDFVMNIDAAPMTATANFREVRAAAIEVDEIVVYIAYVEPILYLREDIIK